MMYFSVLEWGGTGPAFLWLPGGESWLDVRSEKVDPAAKIGCRSYQVLLLKQVCMCYNILFRQ